MTTLLGAARAAIHAVRVQIIPAPRSLVDSREILRILQGYGEITTYRWLKHDALSSAPNSAMAVFADNEAMNRFLQECPLTFEIDRTEKVDPEPETDLNEETQMSDGSTAPLNNPSQRTLMSKQKKPTYQTRPTLFRLNADLWRGRHKDWLERHPFWGPFRRDTKSMIARDLERRVPLPGLADLDANGKREIPVRILRRRREESEGRVGVKEMVEGLRQAEGEETVKFGGGGGAKGGERGHWG